MVFAPCITPFLWVGGVLWLWQSRLSSAGVPLCDKGDGLETPFFTLHYISLPGRRLERVSCSWLWRPTLPYCETTTWLGSKWPPGAAHPLADSHQDNRDCSATATGTEFHRLPYWTWKSAPAPEENHSVAHTLIQPREIMSKGPWEKVAWPQSHGN